MVSALRQIVLDLPPLIFVMVVYNYARHGMQYEALSEVVIGS